MSVLHHQNYGNPPEIIGYAKPWIVAPGDNVAVKISCTEPEYSYRIIRLIQGIELDNSPPKCEQEIKEIPRGQRPGRFQSAKPGSYGYIPAWCPLTVDGGLQVSFYMQPWLLGCSHTQNLISTLSPTSQTGFCISLNNQGSLDISVGNGLGVEEIATALRPKQKTWTKVKLVIHSKLVQLSLTPVSFRAEPVPAPTSFQRTLKTEALLFKPGPLLIAAALGDGVEKRHLALESQVVDFFNGRIDCLKLKACGSKSLVLAKYDFSLDMSTDRIVDISGQDRHGILVNGPTRAVCGYNWDGSECDWTRAKVGYGAIHFHDDDLDDAGWETDFTITIPSNARSGAYAIEVDTTNGRDSDSITFFVRPEQWTGDNRGKVCLVFSTFTYLAYANERLYDTTRQNTADLGPGFDIEKTLKSGEFEKMRRRTDLGLSCYDRHSDGSGVCYSSAKRPILNVRPGYIMWAFSRPREFSADLMMIGFLEREAIPYEILTDHDLHTRGSNALQGFNTVITGSHPEYPSLQSYGAYNAFSRGGGNLMYMGGNGFYWVSAVSHASPHRLEIRRADTGVRPYSLPGGEHVNSLDGQRGGLWRSRGLSCNTLFGVGFCAQGTGLGVPYRRTKVSHDPRFSWMFMGVSGELIGEHGFGGGASGDEIDRYDVANGSPEAAVVLATSIGHSDDFGIAIEDLSYPALNTLGTQTDLIRSDIVYYIGSGGGAVFSVGSINWYCSLAWDDYRNNVARLTANVIKGFLVGKEKHE
ncbi:hypothetical protein N8I77_013397 [Diaporthe amygdali]|uniref:N,N-dimethylformamidase beta subunit-like C-terminal domain-containing protein n=1 Tax=Phomopsis amygdali TaxID=1214568 RepID=A0AAD9VY77_PHOAM|nr:hypothetical protein N8I77_013397 [Diaporthe amygdali]